MEIDITEKIQLFSPLILVYLTNISQLDISGCRFIDPNLLVDTVIFCTGLKKLEMQFCSQFQEKHFVLMLPKLQDLLYADFHSCDEISFAAAFWMLSEMDEIQCINFDPQNPVADVNDWEIILRHFTMVHFGHNIRCKMPFYGNHWRMAQGEDEENEE